MGNLSIQPNKGIHPLLSDFSPIRAQLAAKDNSESSINQKSEGYFSSIWNAFVSVLSSIWNFLTGCCKYGQKEISTDAPSKKTSFESENVKPKLTQQVLKGHLTAFAERVYPQICEINKKISSDPSIEISHSIWWTDINGTKEVFSYSVLKGKDGHDPRSNINNSNIKTDNASMFSLNVLLIARHSTSETRDFYRFTNYVQIEKSSGQFKLANEADVKFLRQTKNKQEANDYVTHYLSPSLHESDDLFRGALVTALRFPKEKK